MDARDWTVDMARDSIRGPVGTTIQMKIEREGVREPLAFPIRRDQVHVSAVTATMVHDSLGYILVDQVARGSAAEVDSAFAVLADAKGIILDLRRNPGGYLVESLSMADLFLDRGRRWPARSAELPGQPNKTVEESWDARLPGPHPGQDHRGPGGPFHGLRCGDRGRRSPGSRPSRGSGRANLRKGSGPDRPPPPGERRIRITTGDWMTPLGRSLHIPRDIGGSSPP